MISENHKCIFVHLRRTAGNSIELALGGIVLLDRDGKKTKTWDNKLHRGTNIPHKLDFRGHYMHDTAQAIKAQFPKKYKKFKKFSVIRNPWDQMISLYLRLNPTDPSAIKFSDWLVAFNTPLGTVPQYSLFDDKGNCLVDEILRFENLQKDFEALCRKFKIKADALNRTNGSAKKHYTEYYDDVSRELVSNIFKDDIQRFGYSFEKS